MNLENIEVGFKLWEGQMDDMNFNYSSKQDIWLHLNDIH